MKAEDQQVDDQQVRQARQKGWLGASAGPAWRRGMQVAVVLLLGAQVALAVWVVRQSRSTVGVDEPRGPNDEGHTVAVESVDDRAAEEGALTSPAATDSAIVSAQAVADAMVAPAEDDAAPAPDGDAGDVATASEDGAPDMPSDQPTAELALKAWRRPKDRRGGRVARRHAHRHRTPPKPSGLREATKVVSVAHLIVRSEPAANVTIDGQARGRTPTPSLALTPGNHRVEVGDSGLLPYVVTVTLMAAETRTLQLALKSKPKPAVATPTPVAAPPPAPTPPPVAAPPPAPTPPPVRSKPVQPEPQLPRTIPTLHLPSSVRVVLFDEGKPTTQVRLVCAAVEQAVGRAMGVSAAGTTRALQKYLRAHYAGEEYIRVKLFPRAMGYVIAQAMQRRIRGIGAIVREAHRSGRLESLTESGWKP